MLSLRTLVLVMSGILLSGKQHARISQPKTHSARFLA